jgi:hypothetical protein
MLTKETLDKIRAKSENTPQKSLRHHAQETGISKLSKVKVMKQGTSTYLNGMECVFVFRKIIFSISYNTGKLILFLCSST